jgi:hypothetical protein
MCFRLAGGGEPLPGKLATLLLLIVGIVGLGALLAWVASPTMFRDKPSALAGFLDELHQRSRELEPDGKVPVRLPRLRPGESILLAMGPSATKLRPDIDLSKEALAAVRADLAATGADLTFVYWVSKGDVTSRERVSRCNLSIVGSDPLVLTAARRTALLECGPVSAWAPGECRDFNGLWNERCAPRLVVK